MIGRRTQLSRDVLTATQFRGSRLATHLLAGALTAILVGCFAGGPGAAAASAQTPDSNSAPLTANAIASSLTDAGYAQGDVPAAHSDGNSALANAAVDVPRDGSDPIRAGNTEVSVPDASGQTARRLDNNTVAYQDGPSATVVQPTSAGETQILRVSNDPQVAREFVVDVASQGDLTINALGGVDITRDGQLVGEIRPPRATLNGEPLATRFVIDGTQVKQVTDVPSGATGTVILDHWFGSYLGCITGVGVPLGSAAALIAWAGPETLWVWVTRGSVKYRAGGPPIVSTIIKKYGHAVYNACRRFMNS